MAHKAWLVRIGVAAAILAGALVVWGAATGFGTREGSSGGEWNDYLTLEAMVSDADAIVIADLMFVETVGVQRDLPNGDVIVTDHKLAAWRATAWITGTATEGDVFYVATGDIPLNIGATHVLFLKARTNTDGLAPWLIPGQPYFALVEPGGELRFVASERYRETWSEQGYEFPVEGSDAPFEATLTDVGRLVAELTATPFATVRPECGPKPPKETIGIRFAGAVTTITWADCWDDEDGFVVEVIYSGTNAAGPVDDRVEYSVAANLTEFDLPAGDGLDGGCGLSMEVRLYVVRGADRQLANGIAVINDCPGQG